MYTLHLGNSLEILPTIETSSIDSIVCDPPYELSDDGKQSSNRVFLEFMFPKESNLVPTGAGDNELSLLVDKVLALGNGRGIPRPSPTMPICPMALDDQSTLWQQDIEHTSVGAIPVPDSRTIGGIEPQDAEYLGSFLLKLTDTTESLQIINQIGTGFDSSGIGVGFSDLPTSLPSLLSGLRPVVSTDQDVRDGDYPLPHLISAFTGTENTPVLRFNLGRTPVETVTADGARLLAAFLTLSGAEFIRTTPTTRSLPTVLESRRISVIDDLANRAFSFDIIIHPQTITSKGFMGKSWDGSKIAYNVDLWREALRILKPGGHLLAFSGSRTYHRMTCAIEDAGFEIRDSMMWVYSTGFPKSLDVSKAIDKAAGAERTEGQREWKGGQRAGGISHGGEQEGTGTRSIYDTPATEAAKQWQGWGTALKPAHEPICVARKPLAKGLTVASNVLAHGTGALNIDGCRVSTDDNLNGGSYGATSRECDEFFKGKRPGGGGKFVQPVGRWPANFIHDGSDEVLALFPEAKGAVSNGRKGVDGACFGHYNAVEQKPGYGDTGSAARFFYCAKTSKKDRNEGCESMPLQVAGGMSGRADGSMGSITYNNNTHPTVKPTDLMRYLCRLVTPPGGTVLDPFIGSGSTGKAAMLEGFQFVGIEMEEAYHAIAKARIDDAHLIQFADML